jgi:hypothetical protein
LRGTNLPPSSAPFLYGLRKAIQETEILNMKFAIAILVFLGLSYASAQPVDPALVGTWQAVVPNSAGAARWVWNVRADGSYDFHAEGPGNIPSHHGQFEAAEGRYTLKAANLDWTDNGTYDPPTNGMVRMSGRLGTGYWLRVSASAGNTGQGANDGEQGLLMKAKNMDKIAYANEMGAEVAGTILKKPIVLFFTGGRNFDAVLYSDAMAALGERAAFGLDPDVEGDPAMANEPASVKANAGTFPRILILMPRSKGGEMGDQDGLLVTYDFEIAGLASGAKYAELIGTELKRLGY